MMSLSLLHVPNMKLYRIQAIMTQELFHTKRSLEVLMDIFFFSVMSALVFGLIAKYITGSQVEAAKSLVIGMALWEVVRVAQYSVTMGALWNIWSRNLSNLFTTPLTTAEFLVAQIASSIIKALLTFIIVSIILKLAFGYDLLELGIANLASFFVNLCFFAFATGLIVLGLIFRYGTRIQALAWSIIFLFQPLSAVFFPVSVLPRAIQKIAYLFPSTYVFESARKALINPVFDMRQFLIAFILNIIYTAVCLLYFNAMFKKSKETGQFARNEG